MNQEFKPGDRVKIDSVLRGTVEGIVVSFETDGNENPNLHYYMVNIDGEVLPVDHILGKMRLS